MKKYDIVKLINITDVYKVNNLYLDAVGIIVDTYQNKSKILFFNDYNEGDYSYMEINNKDLEIIKEKN